MNIETKFSVGDTCYYLDDNKVMQDVITGIEIDVDEDGADIMCAVGQNPNKKEDYDKLVNNIVLDTVIEYRDVEIGEIILPTDEYLNTLDKWVHCLIEGRNVEFSEDHRKLRRKK